MLILLSPSKTLAPSPAPDGLAPSEPQLIDDIAELMQVCKKLSSKDLQSLMKMSESLTELTYQHFQAMALPFHRDNATPALWTFQGDAFRALDAASLSTADVRWAQDHLYVLSGFYGLLRPLDLIQPYRLEMQSRLVTARGKNLYAFWSDHLTQAIDAAHERSTFSVVLNLASGEYSKAVPAKSLAAPMVSAQFKEQRGGTLKTIGFVAKRARGLMARFVIQHGITDREDLQAFAAEGWTYEPALSANDNLLFVRQPLKT